MRKTRRNELKDEAGATTAEYAVCTGAGVGFAGLLFKALTSETGQKIVNTVFDKVIGLLPF
jgi:Flp pilus assembly pilin Flp